MNNQVKTSKGSQNTCFYTRVGSWEQLDLQDKKAIIFYRVKTAAQNGIEISMKAEHKRCLEFSNKNGINVVDTLGVFSIKPNYPELDDILQLLRKHKDISLLIVPSYHNICRDVEILSNFYDELSKHNVEVIPMDKGHLLSPRHFNEQKTNKSKQVKTH